MLPLDNPEVVAMLRARVAAQVARERAWLNGAGLFVAFGLATVICLALRLPLVDPDLKFGQYGSFLVSIGLPITVVWWLATWRVFKAPSDTESVGELIRRLRVDRF